ncbi:hypothetical protein A6M14_01950 [Acinetobacter sp. Ac_877]|uniref:NirD/YgiW/YdeI family stress tolerance protein n=1 Tax=Acinetobacter portensis TaxID=1839785 RepID=UPI00128C9B83|nr:NirD/YgiW/YdeI family stress tolerance protein [Acinetobacter portensis]MPW42322.1 hypothetical protein [Acinetobacter portensis]
MKTLAKTILMVAAMSGASVAMANTAVNQQAFNKAVTVKQALSMKDDAKVQLKGYVVKSVGDEKYEFRDQTGLITVDIDDELWMGKAISAKTPVVIIGEIDIDYKPMKRVEIDVDAVKF